MCLVNSSWTSLGSHTSTNSPTLEHFFRNPLTHQEQSSPLSFSAQVVATDLHREFNWRRRTNMLVHDCCTWSDAAAQDRGRARRVIQVVRRVTQRGRRLSVSRPLDHRHWRFAATVAPAIYLNCSVALSFHCFPALTPSLSAVKVCVILVVTANMLALCGLGCRQFRYGADNYPYCALLQFCLRGKVSVLLCLRLFLFL